MHVRHAFLELRLYANDVLVATSPSPKLWATVLGTIVTEEASPGPHAMAREAKAESQEPSK